MKIQYNLEKRETNDLRINFELDNSITPKRLNVKDELSGDVAESVDALDSKSRSLYVSEGSSPSIPIYFDKEKHRFSFVVLAI